MYRKRLEAYVMSEEEQQGYDLLISTDLIMPGDKVLHYHTRFN
jgi:hypothetical protein